MMDLNSLVFQSTSAVLPQSSPTPEYQYDWETKLYCTFRSFNNPPYFTKQLPCPTTDDIEARICHYEDASIELIELYVQ